MTDIRATLAKSASGHYMVGIECVRLGCIDCRKEKAAARRSRRAARIADNDALSGKVVKRGKKKKSPSMSKLKKLLWEEMRFVVYAESPDRCKACGSGNPPVACHIVPSHEGAATRFFLPNVYRGCNSCNKSEQVRRVSWVTRHEEIFGKDYVEALRDMSRTIFDMDKVWVREQTERMRGLRGAA